MRAIPLLLAATTLAPASARAASPLTWTAPVSVDSGHTPSAIACPSEGLCVAVDREGYVLHSSDPAAPNPSWTAPAQIDPGQTLSALACASTSLCVAVDESGGQLTSTDPAGGASTWRRTSIDTNSTTEVANAITGVSCASASLCVAVDKEGNALTSTDPGASSPSWTKADIDASNRLQAVSCPSESLCTAVDAAGNALSSEDPAAADASWQTRAIDPTREPVAISCASDALCVAVDSAGDALASGDPGAPNPTWSSTEIDLAGVPAGISCTTSGTCVLVDGNGNALAGDDPTAAVPTWSTSTADPSTPMAGVSCLPVGCMAIDTTGRVVKGLLPPPISTVTVAATVSVVHPHPSIAGVPGVGERLHCESGVPSETPATVTYAWVRDASVIAGATNSSYVVQNADAEHHLQCRVTATDAAGSATAGSAFVAVPAAGVLAAVGETKVGKMSASGAVIAVPVTCSSRAPAGCVIKVRVTITQTRAGRPVRHVIVTLATATVRCKQGERRTILLKLDATGRRLLARERRLTVKVSVGGTAIGALEASLATTTITLRNPRGHIASGHKR